MESFLTSFADNDYQMKSRIMGRTCLSTTSGRKCWGDLAVQTRSNSDFHTRYAPSSYLSKVRRAWSSGILPNVPFPISLFLRFTIHFVNSDALNICNDSGLFYYLLPKQQWRVIIFRVSDPLQSCFFQHNRPDLKIFFRDGTFFCWQVINKYIYLSYDTS